MVSHFMLKRQSGSKDQGYPRAGFYGLAENSRNCRSSNMSSNCKVTRSASDSSRHPNQAAAGWGIARSSPFAFMQ